MIELHRDIRRASDVNILNYHSEIPDRAVLARIKPHTCVLRGVADRKGNSVYSNPSPRICKIGKRRYFLGIRQRRRGIPFQKPISPHRPHHQSLATCGSIRGNQNDTIRTLCGHSMSYRIPR